MHLNRVELVTSAARGNQLTLRGKIRTRKLRHCSRITRSKRKCNWKLFSRKKVQVCGGKQVTFLSETRGEIIFQQIGCTLHAAIIYRIGTLIFNIVFRSSRAERMEESDSLYAYNLFRWESNENWVNIKLFIFTNCFN